MTARRLTDRLRGGSDSDSGAALVVVLLLTIIITTLGILAAGSVMGQFRPSAVNRKSVRAVHAAEAGLDVGLARIRAAVDTAGKGKRTSLPCGSGTQPALTGLVGPESDALRYSVVVRYYLQDPSGRDDSWRAANALPCAPGAGTSATPHFALLESLASGSDIAGLPGRGNRKVESVYNFAVTNVNVNGGLIAADRSGYCMRATPAVGSLPTVAPCNVDDPAQIWSYRKDLSIALVSSLSTSTPVCLDADNARAVTVTMQPCAAAQWMRQAWAYNDNGHFSGPTASGGLNNWCIATDTSNPALATRLVTAQACTGNAGTPWVPGTRVGAGAAGSETGRPDANGQLVNYAEFARCFDVTSQTMTSAWMIAYPCKQAVDPTQVRWNQRLQLTAKDNGTYQVWTTKDTDTRCLTAGDGSVEPVSGTRVLMVPCDPFATQQEWTFTGASTDYASSYAIETGDLCLSLAPSPTTDLSLRTWSMVVVATCDGSTVQKWNAPPNLIDAGQRNFRERPAT